MISNSAHNSDSATKQNTLRTPPPTSSSPRISSRTMRFTFWHGRCKPSDLEWLQTAVQALRENCWTSPIYVDGAGWQNDDLRRGAQDLFHALGDNTSAQSLIFQNANMTSSLLQAFADAMRSKTSFRSVTLRKLRVNGAICTVPAAVFENLRVEKLSLTKVALDQDSCRSLTRMIRESEHLKALTLDAVDTDEANLTSILAAIIISKSIVTLRLNNLEWSTNDIKRFLVAVAYNRSISTLSLDGMVNFRDGLCVDLARMLSKNDSLVELSLRKCNISAAGLTPLVKDGILRNQTLRRLFLSRNPLGDASTDALVYLLHQAQHLENLCLVETKLMQGGCHRIASALAHNHGLRKIAMDLNCFEACGDEVVRSLAKNTTLEMVLERLPSILAKNRANEAVWRSVDVYLRANKARRAATHDDRMNLQAMATLLAETSSQPDIMLLFLQSRADLLATVPVSGVKKPTKVAAHTVVECREERKPCHKIIKPTSRPMQRFAATA